MSDLLGLAAFGLVIVGGVIVSVIGVIVAALLARELRR